MATKKERRATEILNVELAGIDSAIGIALSLEAKDGAAIERLLKEAQKHCEAARRAMMTIQSAAALI